MDNFDELITMDQYMQDENDVNILLKQREKQYFDIDIYIILSYQVFESFHYQ
jgi:response regulator of citrate/malate metabolism